MSIVLKNNASDFLAAAIDSAQTTITLTSGASFPTLAGDEYFYATIESTKSVREIVKVTNVAGNTLTVVRAQDGTSAASFAEGSRVEARINAASVEDYVDQNAELAQYNQEAVDAVTRTIQERLQDFVSVKDFGAVGDGVTDDTAAVQAAFDACATSGQGLYFPAGTYNASSALTMGAHNLEMEGTLFYTGSSAITFLTVAASNRNIGLRIQAQTVNWSDDDFIGVQFRGQNNVIYLRMVNGFAIGARFGATGSFAYNTVFPTVVIQNRISLDLYSPTSNEFVNQNTFIGGRCSIFTSSALNSFSRIGVRMGGGNYYVNNNVFLNMNFELKSNLVTGGATSIPILAEYAQRNQFIGCRCEDGATGAAVVEQNESYQNQYSFLFIDSTSEFIDYQGSYRNSQIVTARKVEEREAPSRLIYDSGPIYERANYFDGSTDVFVDGLHFQGSSNSTPTIASTGVTINSDSISFGSTRAIGTFIRVGGARAFRCVASTLSSSVRWNVACFDAAGNRLYEGDPNAPYINGTSANGFAPTGIFGNVYRRAPGNAATFFIRNNDVHTIQVLAAGEGQELQSFQIYADSENVDVYSGVNNLNRRQKLGTAAPSAGTWERGDMVWDYAPTAGGTLGWICTAAGTPGTWKTFGSIAS